MTPAQPGAPRPPSKRNVLDLAAARTRGRAPHAFASRGLHCRRAVEERYETRRVGKSNQSEVVSYQVWAESVTEMALGALGRAPFRLEISFELPEEETYVTALSERPARYWELEASAETPGVDYVASFLLPVYGRDAPTRPRISSTPKSWAPSKRF